MKYKWKKEGKNIWTPDNMTVREANGSKNGVLKELNAMEEIEVLRSQDNLKSSAYADRRLL